MIYFSDIPVGTIFEINTTSGIVLAKKCKPYPMFINAITEKNPNNPDILPGKKLWIDADQIVWVSI